MLVDVTAVVTTVLVQVMVKLLGEMLITGVFASGTTVAVEVEDKMEEHPLTVLVTATVNSPYPFTIGDCEFTPLTICPVEGAVQVYVTEGSDAFAVN